MGKGTTALKKINAETKRLKKRHPGKKYATLRKEAAAKYNAGKLKPKRHKPAKKKKARRKAAVSGKRKYAVTHRVKKVGTRKKARKRIAAKRPAARVRTRTVTKTVYRRVGASGGNSMKMLVPILAIAGIGLAAYFLLKKPATNTLPALTSTANPARNQSATSILQYAQAAGASLAGLAALINALNGMSDSAVVDASQQVRSGMDINTALAIPTGGPSINLS